MITTSFRRMPESSNTNNPRSGQNSGVASLRENIFDRLDSGLRRNDGFYMDGME